MNNILLCLEIHLIKIWVLRKQLPIHCLIWNQSHDLTRLAIWIFIADIIWHRNNYSLVRNYHISHYSLQVPSLDHFLCMAHFGTSLVQKGWLSWADWWPNWIISVPKPWTCTIKGRNLSVVDIEDLLTAEVHGWHKHRERIVLHYRWASYSPSDILVVLADILICTFYLKLSYCQ